MYREVTGNIQIDVEPIFVQERSSPETGYFFYSYQVRIKNLGEKPAQLLSRHWIITDGRGKVEHVKGPGVVGEQPRLMPGDSFEYASACPLPTPTGNMRGFYQMVNDQGESFEARIPLFFLRPIGP